VDDRLSRYDLTRPEAIHNIVETLLDLVAGLRRDPEAVAYAAAHFGMMRIFHLHGCSATIGFTHRCIKTDLSQP